jgi:hypothetical protein
MNCPDCAEEIPDGSRFCPLCKANLVGGGGSVVDPQKAQEIKSKISKLNKMSFAFAVPGLLMAFGPAAAEHTPENAHAAQPFLLVGGLLIVVGLACYASMKGRSAAWGLMGLLYCLGILFLALMAKCCHNCRQIGGRNATECANCHAPM